MMTRLVVTVLVLFGLCTADSRVLFGQGTAPPNIVLMIADDLGWGDLGCYGSSWIRSPNIDWLAQNGCRFTDYYCVVPKCSPTRASILTGKYPASRRIHNVVRFQSSQNAAFGTDDHLTTSGIQLGKMFQRRGYTTGYFGKWHLGSHPGAPLVTEYGFDVAETCISRGWTWHPNQTPDFHQKIDEYITDEALDFVWNSQSPFLMVVSFVAPHAPLNPSQQDMAPYAAYRDDRVPHVGGHEIYGGAVTNLDRQVGRILQVLPTNTIVVFTSDNGAAGTGILVAEEEARIVGTHHRIASSGPFRLGKDSVYEGGIRVPFIVYWPEEVSPAILNSTIFSSIDILPSLISIVDGRLPSSVGFDGEDLSDALKGNNVVRQSPLFFEYRYGRESPLMAVRDGNFKLLANPDGSRVELYDLSTSLGLREVDQIDDPNREAAMFQMLINWRNGLPNSPVDPQAGILSYELPDYSTN